MALGEVLREFGVKVSLAFDGKKIDEAENKINKFGDQMRSFALEVAGVTAGLFATGKTFTSFGRSITNQAGALNISTDALQEYEYAAGVAADANREDLVGSFQSLGDTLDKARAGDKDARQALFNLANAAGRGSELITKLQDPLFKVTDAAHLLSDGIHKMSLTNPLAARRMTELAFGSDKLYNLWRQGPDVLDKLNKEADKNSVLNQRMIDEGNRLDMQLTKIWFTFRKFGLLIGENVIRHMTPMINQFMRWFQLNQKIIASGINAFLDVLTDVVKGLWVAFGEGLRILSPIVKMLGGVAETTKLVIGAFLAFKAIQFGATFAKAALAIGELSASILPVAAPILAIVAGLSSLAGIVQTIWAVLSGGKLEDTWLGQLGDKFYKMFPKLNVGDKIFDFLHPGAAAGGGKMPFSSASPSSSIVHNRGGSVVNQEHNITNNLTVTTPAHASVAHVAAATKKAQSDANEDMLRKAKADSARSRQY